MKHLILDIRGKHNEWIEHFRDVSVTIHTDPTNSLLEFL